ncbi:hypothetical protein AN958_11213 [Leucoagaricus sp. SymC.cos]|nr:hypothetical protein AN958_11213 [Leucoagaricus sp. SymC.cos]
MDKLKDAQYFTKFDVRLGYNNIQIHPKTNGKLPFALHSAFLNQQSCSLECATPQQPSNT